MANSGSKPEDATTSGAKKNAEKSAPIQTWACPYDDFVGSSPQALKGHNVGAGHFRAAPSVSPSAVPGTVLSPGSVPPSPPEVEQGSEYVMVHKDAWKAVVDRATSPPKPAQKVVLETDDEDEFLKDLDSEAKAVRKERVMMQDRAAHAKAMSDLQRFENAGSAVGEADSLRAKVNELEQKLTQAAYDSKLQAIAAQQSLFQTQQTAALAEIRNLLTQKGANGSNGSSTIHDALALAGALKGPSELALIQQAQAAGIVGRLDGAPTSELAARAQLASEKLRHDHAAAERKEMQEAATGDRLVGLAAKAIDTIADPISKAVGESIKGGARMQGQLQSPQTPVTREQKLDQLRQINELVARATEARQRIEAEMGEPVNVPVPPPPVPTNGGVAPTTDPGTPGTIFRGKR